MSSFRVSRPWLALALVSAVTPALAQQKGLTDILTGKPLKAPAGGVAAADTPESVILVQARLNPPAAGGPATVSVTAKIQPNWHIYSLTQKPVEALPTTITIDKSADYRLTGEFRPDLPPQVHRRDGNDFEEYENEVT